MGNSVPAHHQYWFHTTDPGIPLIPEVTSTGTVHGKGQPKQHHLHVPEDITYRFSTPSATSAATARASMGSQTGIVEDKSNPIASNTNNRPTSYVNTGIDTNSSVLFGGVSGRQVVVFSVFHKLIDPNGAIATDPDATTASAHAIAPPILLGQAAVYLSHRSAWADGFRGKLMLSDKDEVS